MVEVPEASDAELVRKAAESPAAFEALFVRHRDAALGAAMKLLGNREDALDGVQEAFIKAYRNLRSFRGRSKFRTWLLRIVANTCYDMRRRHRREPKLRFDDDLTEGSVRDSERARATGEGPAAAAERRELESQLAEALQRLSPTHREVFLLFFSENMSYDEIAGELGISPGTVMSRLFYARQKLQAALRAFL